MGHVFDAANGVCINCGAELDHVMWFHDAYDNCIGQLAQCCNGSPVLWDKSNNGWKCSKCGVKVMPAVSEQKKPQPEYNQLNLFTKCECGSDKTYGNSAGHSSWCPKYTKV